MLKELWVLDVEAEACFLVGIVKKKHAKKKEYDNISDQKSKTTVFPLTLRNGNNKEPYFFLFVVCWPTYNLFVGFHFLSVRQILIYS